MADLRALTRFSTTTGASIAPRLVLDTDRVAAGGMVQATAATPLSFQTTGANSDITLSATRSITLGATTGAITLSAVDDSSITLSANSALAKTFSITVTNVGGGTGDISLSAANGTFTAYCNGTMTLDGRAKTYIGGNAVGSINIGNNVTPTALNVYSSVATISANLTSALQLVASDPAAQTLTITCSNVVGDGNLTMSCKSTMDVDCTTYTLDALTGGISLDATSNSNFTVAAASAGARALTISCTNSLGGAGNLTFSCKSTAGFTCAAFTASCTANINLTSSAGSFTGQGAGAASLVSTAAATYVTGFTQTEVTATQGYLGLFSTWNNIGGYIQISSTGSYIRFHDVYKNTSTYVNPFYLSGAQSDWDNYVTNFGQVSLLNAINQCAGSAVTLDDAYNASAGASTITVDVGDVTWALTGAYSSIISLTACTNAADGFLVENGTDYFRVLWGAANQIDVNAEVSIFDINCRSFDVNTTQDISLYTVGSSNFTVAANGAGAATLTLNCTNAGAGTGNLTLACKTTMDVDCAAYTLDTTGGISIDAITGSNFTITGNAAAAVILTISVTNAAGLGNIDLSCKSTLNIDCTDCTLDATAAISLDAATASNFTVSGAAADLTLGARAATITLNEAGNTTLSGFTATSIVGALNELKSSGGAAATISTTIPGGASTPDSFAAATDGGAEWLYIIQFAGNIRAGTLLASWDQSVPDAKLYETVTTDMGVTTDITFAVTHTGANMTLTAANAGVNVYNFKALRRKVTL